MKKLLYLLLVLPFALAFTSCDNDDKLPDVNIALSFDNAVVSDGALYVLDTDTLELTNIVTTPVDGSKAATLANIRFYWNYLPAPALTWSPMPIKIPMAEMPLASKGANLLGFNATLLQVDKSIAYTSFNIPIVAISDADQFPDGQVPGPVTINLRIGQSKSEK